MRSEPLPEPLAPLFGRYRAPLPIATRPTVHLLAARCARTDARRVLLLGGPAARPEATAQMLARVRAAHDALAPRDPRVPAVCDGVLEGPRPYLAFACDAVADGDELLRALGEHSLRLPYGAADAFIATVREVLTAAHEAPGGPYCLGRVAASNVLLSAEGGLWVVGFGSNFCVEREPGVLDGGVHFTQAPELAGGGAPSALGDYVALLLFRRGLLPFVALEGRLARLLRGEVAAGDEALLEALKWTELRVVNALPHERPTLREALAVAQAIRDELGVGLDRAGFAACAREALRGHGDEVPPATVEDSPAEASGEGVAPVLVLARDGSWIAGPEGERQRLGSALRRVLLALVAARARGGAVSLWELLEAGWPGEQPLAEAGANRVYVTLNRLRRLGVGAALERFDSGYRLAPRVQVRLVEP